MAAVLSPKSAKREKSATFSTTFSPRSGSPTAGPPRGILSPKSRSGPLSPKSATSDAFATFLSKRPNGELQEVPVWPLMETCGIPMQNPVVEEAMAGATGLMSPSKAQRFKDKNPFATFLQMRPPKKLNLNAREVALNEEILRTKRQLLEVALIDELRTIDPTKPGAGMKQRIQRLNRASKHLEEQMEVLNGSNLVLGGFDLAEAGPSASPPEAWSRQTSITRESPPHSASAPVLKTASTAADAFHDAGQRRGFRRELASKVKGMLPPMPTGPPPQRRVPLLSGWWTDTRTWNTRHPLDSKARLVRHDPSKGGGCIAIGNGRIPLFDGGQFVCPGYYYAFRVDSIADEHFPREGPKLQTIAFGVSRVPGSDRRCLKPNEAFEIPSSVVVGYSKQMIDGGKWKPYRSHWDPASLEVGDVVGVLVPSAADKAGDFAVFVNGEQKLRLACSLAKDELPEEERRTLYPLVDLHGRISAVTLLCNAKPPNSVLNCRNKCL